MADARSELLGRIVDDVARHGLGDRSLRELAASVGTSHRMLHYHFGSRDGLVAAIVDEVEARQRELLAGTVRAGTGPGTGDPADTARAIWARVSDPAMLPFVELFFETVAVGSRTGHTWGRNGDLTSGWVDTVTTVAEQLAAPVDALDARLGAAVVRGLLVDVLSGGDLATANAAFERFLSVWTTFAAEDRSATP